MPNKEEFVPEQMTEGEIARAMGGTVVTRTPSVFSDDDVQRITSWDDIANLLHDKGLSGTDFADEVLGDGYALLGTDDKISLVGKPLHFLDWSFHAGNMGEFVSVRAVQMFGNKPNEIRRIRFADGSTGILQQLKAFSLKFNRTHSLTAKRGLTVSEYEYEDPKTGEMRPAKTYYIDTSATA